MTDSVIYLDHAAATPLDPRVREAMEPYYSDLFYNPSSPYAPALAVRREYEDAKARLARTFGGKGDELIITAGATESINLAFGAVSGHVVISSIEHHAVLASAAQKPHTVVAVGASGVVDPAAVMRAVRPDTQLVSIGLANNELGTIQPLREIAALLRTERERRLARGEVTPLYLHSDASQGVGQLDVHVARLGVDLLTLNAGKVYGPKQVGLLWSARHVQLQPVIVGGGQERGLRSGTENVAGTIGFARAMELAERSRTSETERLRELRDTLEAKLLEACPEAVVSGSRKKRLAGHLHIAFPGIDAERLVFALEARGILVATGSACAANKGTRSHVLTAIGMDPLEADGSLRLSLGHLSTEDNIRRAVEGIIEVVRQERQRLA